MTMKIMKKIINKSIGVLLSLVMLVSVFSGMEVMADSTQPMAADCNITCEFDNEFSLVYYYKINSTGNFTKPYLNVVFFKYNDSGANYTRQTINVTDYTYDSASKTYRFVFSGISAAEMGNTVQARLCAFIGSQVYASDYSTYSVKQYAEDVLAAKMGSSAKADKTLCTLMVDMLNYGSSAQVYFGRHIQVFANKDLTSAQRAVASKLVTSANTCLKKGSFANPKATLQKFALSFDNSVEPVVYASFASEPGANVYAELSYKDIEGVQKKIKVDSSSFEKDTATGLYRMEFEGISPLYFSTPFTVVFKEGNNAISATTTYSVESYAHDILAGIAKLRAAFDKHGIMYQMAELGKVDQGGGGTIAYINGDNHHSQPDSHADGGYANGRFRDFTFVFVVAIYLPCYEKREVQGFLCIMH